MMNRDFAMLPVGQVVVIFSPMLVVQPLLFIVHSGYNVATPPAVITVMSMVVGPLAMICKALYGFLVPVIVTWRPFREYDCHL